MKPTLIQLALLAALAGCQPGSGEEARPSAAVRAATRQLIQGRFTKRVTYSADLGWHQLPPLYAADAGEVTVRQLAARWDAEWQRSNGVVATILQVTPDTAANRRRFGPDWRAVITQAATGGDEAEHRAQRLDKLRDSLARVPRPPAAAAGAPIAQVWQHYFQLTKSEPKVLTERDTIELLVLPSQQVLLYRPLPERFTQPPEADRF